MGNKHQPQVRELILPPFSTPENFLLRTSPCREEAVESLEGRWRLASGSGESRILPSETQPFTGSFYSLLHFFVVVDSANAYKIFL